MFLTHPETKQTAGKWVSLRFVKRIGARSVLNQRGTDRGMPAARHFTGFSALFGITKFRTACFRLSYTLSFFVSLTAPLNFAIIS